ncbi:6-carboxytetrahydropterin synthase QueD [bacterium]|nr:6-carboxytetrahydropterin synthase QueD [bacterium]
MVTDSFAAAHSLKFARSKCENLHGHNWKVEVFVCGKGLDKSGMLMDFDKLKAILKEIISKLDHKNLDDLQFLRENSPSSEIIAEHIFLELVPNIPEELLMKEVRVWESADSCASYTSDE